jgi:dephospho-CoA kinase
MVEPVSRLRIGLTGGIGSGKSTAASTFVALGAALIDSDAIARTLTGPNGAAMSALRQAFGPAIAAADGSLDRDAMRTRAFGDPATRQRLEAILHPMIASEALAQAAAATARLVVFDIPLLAESSHWRDRLDRILVIDCDEATQVERVARRPGWTLEAARRVVASQATRAARRAIADAVIHNGAGVAIGQVDTAVRTVAALWNNDRHRNAF